MTRNGDWFLGSDFVKIHGLSKAYVSVLKKQNPRAVKKEGKFLWINPYKANFVRIDLREQYGHKKLIDEIYRTVMILQHYHINYRIARLMSVIGGNYVNYWNNYTIDPVMARCKSSVRYVLHGKRIIRFTERSLNEIGRADYCYKNAEEAWESDCEVPELTKAQKDELFNITKRSLIEAYRKN